LKGLAALILDWGALQTQTYTSRIAGRSLAESVIKRISKKHELKAKMGDPSSRISCADPECGGVTNEKPNASRTSKLGFVVLLRP